MACVLRLSKVASALVRALCRMVNIYDQAPCRVARRVHAASTDVARLYAMQPAAVLTILESRGPSLSPRRSASRAVVSKRCALRCSRAPPCARSARAKGALPRRQSVTTSFPWLKVVRTRTKTSKASAPHVTTKRAAPNPRAADGGPPEPEGEGGPKVWRLRGGNRQLRSTFMKLENYPLGV